MGLLDSLDTPEMALSMGLLNAGGPSRFPVSVGQGMSQAFQQAREAKQQQEMNAFKKLQMDHLKAQMDQESLMRPLQLQQLQNSIKQAELQQKIPGMIQEALVGIQGAKPQVYQDQMPNNADVGGNMTPESYFKLASGIQDPNEKRAAIEAGFRKWPEMRPTMNAGEQDAMSRDAATKLANIGMMLGTSGLHGGDSVLKAAEFYKPQELKEGATYRNPVNGATQYMPKMEVGMRPNAQGGVESVPGMMDFLKQKTLASVNPIDAAKLKYETGVDVGGNQQTPTSGLPPKAANAIKEGAYTGANDDWIKNSYRPTLDAGKSADNIITTTNSLRNIDIKTGWGTEAKAYAANVLAGLGIAPENAKMYAASAQQFQSQAMTRLWEVLNTAKGPQTEGDADRAKATFASLKNTPEANQFIIDLAEANARRDKIRAQFYAEAMPVARDNGDLTAVDRKWQTIQKSVWDDPIMTKWRK